MNERTLKTWYQRSRTKEPIVGKRHWLLKNEGEAMVYSVGRWLRWNQWPVDPLYVDQTSPQFSNKGINHWILDFVGKGTKWWKESISPLETYGPVIIRGPILPNAFLPHTRLQPKNLKNQYMIICKWDSCPPRYPLIKIINEWPVCNVFF